MKSENESSWHNPKCQLVCNFFYEQDWLIALLTTMSITLLIIQWTDGAVKGSGWICTALA